MAAHLAPLLALAIQAVAAPDSSCIAPDAAVGLDHAIVVVRNLDSAAARLAPLGFRFKLGRLHPDSILNRHIKFPGGSEVELMTVAGTPTSRMARDYADLLRAGEGGVYAALWTADMDRVRAEAARIGRSRFTRLGAWQFLSLPGVADTRAVFFGAGGLPVNDPDSVLAHPNGAIGLATAWVEGGPALRRLLAALGGRPCGSVTLPGGRAGTRWALAQGSLVLVAGGGRSPRVLGVEIERRGGGEPRLFEPLPGFWMLLR
jgi:hypothetical protein